MKKCRSKSLKRVGKKEKNLILNAAFQKKEEKLFFLPLCRSPCRHYSSINWPIKMFILFARFSHQIETWKENLGKNCLLKTYSGKEIQFRLFDKLVTYFSVNAFFSRFHYFSSPLPYPGTPLFFPLSTFFSYIFPQIVRENDTVSFTTVLYNIAFINCAHNV